MSRISFAVGTESSKRRMGIKWGIEGERGEEIDGGGRVEVKIKMERRNYHKAFETDSCKNLAKVIFHFATKEERKERKGKRRPGNFKSRIIRRS